MNPMDQMDGSSLYEVWRWTEAHHWQKSHPLEQPLPSWVILPGDRQRRWQHTEIEGRLDTTWKGDGSDAYKHMKWLQDSAMEDLKTFPHEAYCWAAVGLEILRKHFICLDCLTADNDRIDSGERIDGWYCKCNETDSVLYGALLRCSSLMWGQHCTLAQWHKGDHVGHLGVTWNRPTAWDHLRMGWL